MEIIQHKCRARQLVRWRLRLRLISAAHPLVIDIHRAFEGVRGVRAPSRQGSLAATKHHLAFVFGLPSCYQTVWFFNLLVLCQLAGFGGSSLLLNDVLNSVLNHTAAYLSQARLHHCALTF